MKKTTDQYIGSHVTLNTDFFVVDYMRYNYVNFLSRMSRLLIIDYRLILHLYINMISALEYYKFIRDAILFDVNYSL